VASKQATEGISEARSNIDDGSLDKFIDSCNLFNQTIQNLVDSLQASIEDSLISNVFGAFFIGIIKVLKIAQTEVQATSDATTADTLVNNG
jgi:hypothetical protein